MFDIGWPEMAVVAVIALIIIGPKDLPRILRYAGKWAGKARRMAREFQRNFDDMVRESELDDVKKSVESASSFNPVKDIGNSIDPTGEMKADIESLAKDDDEQAKPEPTQAKPEQAKAKPKQAKAKPKQAKPKAEASETGSPTKSQASG